MSDTKYTLVQHSGYGYNGNAEFSQAVEERSVTPKMAVKVKQAGGILFDDYSTAYDAANAENYPPEVRGLIPHARGTFSLHAIDGLKIYIPHRTGLIKTT